MATEIKVPDIGGFKDVNVIEVLVKSGEVIDKETPLITIETDKAAMDVPSPLAGKIVDVKLKQGDKVSEGSVIATVEAAGAGTGKGDAAPAESGDDAGAGGTGAEEKGRQSERADAPQPDPEAVSAGSGSNPPVDEEDRPREAASADAESDGGDAPRPAGVERRDAPRKSAGSGGGGPGGRGSAGGGEASGGAVHDDAERGSVRGGAGRGSDQKAAAPVIDEHAFSEAYASPSIRKFARELGADLGKIKGTGPKGRISADDVKAHVKTLLSAPPPPAQVSPLPKVPVVDFAQFGPTEIKPLSRIQKISGARLQASWLNLPHVTQHEDADITDLEEMRTSLKAEAAKEGVKLTPLAFIVKACVAALREFPRFNASLDPGGENLVLKKYFNIGFAADTPNGLVVPVIVNANRLTLFGVAQTLAELSEKARAGKLKAAEMQGGSFTVSSLGGIGGTAFTPIINAPEVAILGVSRSSHKPVYKDGAFIPRLMLPLSLSYDHRVIDGAEAARFAVFLAKVLADPKALM